MAKKFVFTRRSPEALESIHTDPDAEAELKAAARRFPRGELIPESVWRVANALVTQRARTLAFATRQPYLASLREVLVEHPHLRLGVTAYMYDKHFPDVEFVEAETHDND